MTRGERMPRRLALIAVASAIVIAVPAAIPASAAWEARAVTAADPLLAGKLATPVLSCDPVAGVVPAAKLSWPKVTGATGYVIAVGGTGAKIETTDLSLTVTGALLITLLTSVLFGTSQSFTVTAKVGSWSSSPSNAKTIGVTNVVTGLLGGVTCQP